MRYLGVYRGPWRFQSLQDRDQDQRVSEAAVPRGEGGGGGVVRQLPPPWGIKPGPVGAERAAVTAVFSEQHFGGVTPPSSPVTPPREEPSAPPDGGEHRIKLYL